LWNKKHNLPAGFVEKWKTVWIIALTQLYREELLALSGAINVYTPAHPVTKGK
jgi:hypothetical protein